MRSLWFGFLLILMMFTPLQAQEATPQPDDPVTRTITIWLPADLISPNDNDTLELFTAQIDAFMLEHPNITVSWRFKRIGEAGGILSTLRTASAVAPGALPDITLMRRQDLINAQRGGLIQAWEGLLPSSLLVNLQQRLALGQVDERLYGIPYTLDVLHLVYHGEQSDRTDWTYADVLERGIPLVLPLGRASGIPPVAYVQYRADGATLNADGLPDFNAQALERTLTFYEQLRDRELISPSTLDFNSSADYLPAVEIDTERIFLLSSTQYLALQNDQTDRHIAPLPTADGQPASLINSWMWVLVANTTEQQNNAALLVDWLSQADRQATITGSINRLPSHPNALGQVVINPTQRQRFASLIDNAYLPLAEGDGDTFSRAFEDALIAIIRDERTASEALAEIENLLAD